MIRWMVSYLTLKEIPNTRYVKGWKCYRDCYGDPWLKTDRWSFFRVPIRSERDYEDDWFNVK